LLDYISKMIQEQKLTPSQIVEPFMQVGFENQGADHVILPYFRTMHLLLSNQILVTLNP
jgi:hypothetical protein